MRYTTFSLSPQAQFFLTLVLTPSRVAKGCSIVEVAIYIFFYVTVVVAIKPAVIDCLIV